MAGIPLSQVGTAIVVSPGKMDWSKKSFILKTASFPKGSIPPHLRGRTEQFAAAARACAAETRGLRGSALVKARNACISKRLGGR